MSNKSFKSFKAFRDFIELRPNLSRVSYFERVFHFSGKTVYMAAYHEDDDKIMLAIYWTSYKELDFIPFDTIADRNNHIAQLLTC